MEMSVDVSASRAGGLQKGHSGRLLTLEPAPRAACRGIDKQARSPRRLFEQPTRDLGNSPEAREWFRRRGAEWENRGQPVFDHCRVVTRRGDVLDHLDFVADVFDRLPVGLSCVLLHPAIDTAEIRSATSDWRERVADFEVFRQPSLRHHIRNLGIDLISYRPICDAMRRRPVAGTT